MRVLEITQDGAGMLYFGEDDGDGLYTDDVQSCVVYAFYGEKGLCVIHDTGQLSVDSISSLVAKCGVINKVYCAKNAFISALSPEQTKAHKDRWRRILSKIGCTNDHDVSAPTGAIVFLKNSDPISDKGKLSEILGAVEAMPQKIRRHDINILNNLFLKRNAQSLDVDLQYDDGSYTAMPRLQHKLETMRRRAHAEAQKGDMDFLNALERAKLVGIL